uniref:Splicing coactivator subunit-like protein n=1 Tax=Oryza sativa subsp. indica TaxID=39946 RepID=C8TFH6_ORYSI|nr:splicing coactivator subunit-like protein [Oryza sativa Indica Group]BAI39900.1 splicing coactivator subunit-like protein [Oryza sativa Indica Group]
MVTAGDHRRGGAAPEREEGRGKANGGPRLTPGQRRRRERRPERRETAARLGMTMTTVLRRSASETEARTRSTAMRRCRGRCRRVGRRSGAAAAANRSTAATAGRRCYGASTIPTARVSGERRKRKSGARGGFK